MKRDSVRSAVAFLTMSGILGGCALLDRPDIAGTVLETRPDEVLLQLDDEHSDIGDDAWVSLRLVPAEDKDAVAVGDGLSAWLEPGIEDSDPPGVSATRIRVTAGTSD